MSAETITKWEDAGAIMPDYGSDAVLTKVMHDRDDSSDLEARRIIRAEGLINPRSMEVLAALGASSIALDCMDVLEGAFGVMPEEVRPLFWQVQHWSGTRRCIYNDIAKRAIIAAPNMNPLVLQDAPRFYLDILSIASDLIKYKRRDWLGHNGVETHKWQRSNPLAGSILEAIHGEIVRCRNKKQPPIDSKEWRGVPSNIAATRFIYEENW